MQQTTSEAIVQQLELNGVRLVFGIPGTHNLPLYRELGASNIRHVTPRHEQGGGYAADAYSRASGLPGVVVTTSGPGLTNVVTAAATAYADSVPMLVISPGPPADSDPGEHGLLHEMKDQRSHMEAVVDRTYRVKTPAEAVHAINDIFSRWKYGRTRPVYLEIPLDRLESVGEVPVVDKNRSESVVLPNRHDIEDAAKAIADAGSQVLVLGSGAKNSVPETLRLAELLQCPVVTTVNGKGVFPESHPLSLGATIRLDGAVGLINTAETVIIVGATLGDSEFGGVLIKPQGNVVRIDCEYGQLDLNVQVTHKIWSDASVAVAALTETLNDQLVTRPAPKNSTNLKRAYESVQEQILRGSPLYAEVHNSLLAALPTGSTIVGDSAQVSYLGTAFHLKAERYGQFLYPTRFATLGYGIPGGIGASLAATGFPVLVLIGDGGAMFTIQEFATAVDLRLNLPIVIINNGGFEEIRQQMVQKEITPLGVAVRPPNFPLLGQALGGEGILLQHIDQLGEAVRDALKRSVPTLIELRVND